MKVVGFIPLRGGSKSIPRKNIKLIGGYPLCYWVIKAAVRCSIIDKIFIATNDSEITKVINDFGFEKVQVIGRSEDSETDVASSEKVLIEFCQTYLFDSVFFIQATSPLLSHKNLSQASEALKQGKYDSMLSVVRQKRFIWQQNQQGVAAPVNYQLSNRPRRQDMAGFFIENGAFYLSTRLSILESRCRLSGKIGIYEMPEESYHEIDEIHDWIIAEQLLLKRTENI